MGKLRLRLGNPKKLGRRGDASRLIRTVDGMRGQPAFYPAAVRGTLPTAVQG
jgi:hypothetical protein